MLTTSPLDEALRKLSDTQRTAALWRDGAVLILAGPGSGKTQVLTCRIGSMLGEAPGDAFRILALTFTNLAADEMKGRVAAFVPGLEDRATIATFHSFCGQVLRQHGVHLGIGADFTIYSLDEDRRAVLKEAVACALRSGKDVEDDVGKALSMIDRLKSRLVSPERALQALSKLSNGAQIAASYQIYEEELKKNNALDFNSLILEAHRLFVQFPAIAARYRKSYRYWLVDEFQDTTDAQYKLIQAMAGGVFHNLFVVADDDQIIYQWNGASFRQIQRLCADYDAKVVQLPTNYRCPPAIVDAANQLVSHNLLRTESKQPLIAAKSDLRFPAEEHIRARVFDDSIAEAHGIASEIAEQGSEAWAGIAVLARTRTLLEGVYGALVDLAVPAVISQRRDDFLSAEIRFLAACLRQACRPLDQRNLNALVESFNRVSGLQLTTAQLVAEAEATGESYVRSWLRSVSEAGGGGGSAVVLRSAAERVFASTALARKTVDEIVEALVSSAPRDAAESADLREDIAVWKLLARDIGRHIGSAAPLDQFLQELQLRSKEPPAPPNAVTLMTVHASKGREFDAVYLIGLAEDVLPSFQSKQKGDDSPEMEEERRNCFVAITRAKERLILSRAEKYRGWGKAPSRFLSEMGVDSRRE